MKIVLDANIIISALLGSKRKIALLTEHNNTFYAPQRIIEEIQKYAQEICERMEWTKVEFDAYYNALLRFITVVDYNEYEEYMNTAKDAIRRDTKDADYIACALKIRSDFIWTEDKDFIDQDHVAILNTEDLIEMCK